jgi:ABC-2 type transport system ATP-binding protein
MGPGSAFRGDHSDHFSFLYDRFTKRSGMSVISVRDLRKAYDGHNVLKGITMAAESGGIIGYIGPNGAGKSTTIKILTGIISDFEGEATVLGMDIRKEAIEVKKRIGYIPENAALYEVLTPFEFLGFVGKLHGMDPSAIDKKSRDLLGIFGLADKADQRMNTYSKGMRQKVLLISGLIHNPDIIFLDEPLSGLDANAVILVKEILAQLKKAGKTIFYSSHLMDVVEKLSDRIILIHDGTVIADGTFESLKEQSHSGSLENIFTQLTGSGEQETSAGAFIDIMKY